MCYHALMKAKIPTKKDFSSGGLVWDAAKKKVLVVRVQNLVGSEVWTFPKGHPESDEDDKAAAIREVREETGWDCTIKKLLMDVRYWYTHKGVRYDKTVRWFLMKPVECVGTFQEKEILGCAWTSLAEAKTLITYSSDKALLKKLESVL